MPRDHARIDPNRAGDALRRLVDLVSHRSGAVFKMMNNASITLPQVLLLSRVEKSGAASLSDLAEGSTASAAALSQMIERLVQQGLLDRAEDPVDRRRKAIRVTARARALLRKLEAARSADHELGLASLGDGLRTRLAAMLERVVAEIENARTRDRRDAPADEEIAR
ncbi:MAG: MarR family transcriptional regulator [Hyphomicrobiales bacterium]|nr:MarR family transcriptional regulator [Hyphomicrobiales bacterium]MBV8442138.1 MarR family transcriptional regulator [Hyphomicrobiales bacterium]